MGFLAGKRAFIVGVATDRSIAWGIARAMQREGAELAFSYPNDRLKERVEPLARSLGSQLTMQLDVTVDEQVDASFERIKREWGHLDIVVHAVAYAPGEALKGSFSANTTREAFRIAHDVSSYSFTALARAAQPLMAQRQGALLTLSYLGADQNAGGGGNRRIQEDAEPRRGGRAAAPQRHSGGCRECSRIPVLGHGS